MKIYHYTKGVCLYSIFTDGFIATEKTRNWNNAAAFLTDLAWFTENKTYPKTALPYIPSIPTCNLRLQASIRNLHTDYVEIGEHVGRLWRFSFSSETPIFEKWHFSNAKKEFSQHPAYFHFDKIARNVGDQPRKWWVSSRNVPLTNTTLEWLSPSSRVWKIVMDEFSITDKSPLTQGTIANLSDYSKELCNLGGFHPLDLRKAA